MKAETSFRAAKHTRVEAAARPCIHNIFNGSSTVPPDNMELAEAFLRCIARYFISESLNYRTINGLECAPVMALFQAELEDSAFSYAAFLACLEEAKSTTQEMKPSLFAAGGSRHFIHCTAAGDGAPRAYWIGIRARHYGKRGLGREGRRVEAYNLTVTVMQVQHVLTKAFCSM